MKALLYRQPATNLYTDARANHDWNIYVFTELHTQEDTRNFIRDYLKSGYEVQLIDYTVHNDHIYNLDTVLDDMLLGTVESFHSYDNNDHKLSTNDAEFLRKMFSHIEGERY